MYAEMQHRLSSTFSEALTELNDKLIEFVPQIVLAFVVLLVGIVVAELAKKTVQHFFDLIALDKLMGKVNVDRALRAVGIRNNVSSILCLLVHWFLIFVTLLLISEVLKLDAVSEAIGAIVSYIPHLIAGVLILVIGLLVGRFFREALSTSLARAGITSSEIIGLIAQVLIIIFACVLGLRQIGFDVSIISTNLAVILGVLLVTVGAAVALAIRPVLEEYFIAKQLRRHLHPGDNIKFEKVKGEVIEISNTSVVVHCATCDNEDIVIPVRSLFAKRFAKPTETSTSTSDHE